MVDRMIKPPASDWSSLLASNESLRSSTTDRDVRLYYEKQAEQLESFVEVDAILASSLPRDVLHTFMRHEPHSLLPEGYGTLERQTSHSHGNEGHGEEERLLGGGGEDQDQGTASERKQRVDAWGLNRASSQANQPALTLFPSRTRGEWNWPLFDKGRLAHRLADTFLVWLFDAQSTSPSTSSSLQPKVSQHSPATPSPSWPHSSTLGWTSCRPSSSGSLRGRPQARGCVASLAGDPARLVGRLRLRLTSTCGLVREEKLRLSGRQEAV